MTTKFIIVESTGAYIETLGYASSEFINTSAGAGDSGKPIVLDAAGKIAANMLDLTAIDHGGLSGLADDDHTQYSLASGTRAFTGKVSYNSHPSFTTDTELIDKKYVDDIFLQLEWQDSVLDADTLDPTSLTPSTGDRYLINGTGVNGWAGQDNKIAEWNGSAWIYTTPTIGMRVGADDEPNTAFYLYGGATWQAKSVEVTTASTGLTKVVNDIRLDTSSGGDGLGFAAGVLSVNVDDATIETNADTLRVKADGINDTHIDFGTGTNQVSALDIPIADSGAYTTETEVEGALQELYLKIKESGNEYTSNGVAIGDVCYITSNDTVDNYSVITTFQKGIGLASATVTATNPVRVLANDTRLDGILSGATAGDVYYWNGTTHINSIPTTSNAYVLQTGVAINATDLAVEVRPVKKNS